MGLWLVSVRADDSLTNQVPASAGFFAELRNGTDLLTPLSDPQIWALLAELAGQPAGVEEATVWRDQIKQTVRMEPAEAIRTLFAQRVAFVGRGPGQSQDAVVLCRPAPDLPAEGWPGRWQAKPLGGYANPKTFQLSGNIGVSVVKDVLLFGDVLAPDATFKQIVEFASNGKPELSLAASPDFKALLARAPKDPEGLMFLRIGGRSAPAPASAPATTVAETQPGQSAAVERGGLDFPGSLHGARQVLLGLRREGRWLDLTIVGDARAATTQPASQAAGPAWLTAKLPADVVVAWEGDVRMRDLMASVEALPERNVLRAAYKLQQQQQLIEPVLEVLQDHACIAVGWVTPPATASQPAPAAVGGPESQPGSQPTSAPAMIPLPALAALVPVKNGELAWERVADLVEASATVLDFLALAAGGKPLSRERDQDIDGQPVHVLDLTRVLSPEAARYYELQLCWTIHNETLIVSSHLGWLRSILAARTGRSSTIADSVPSWTAADRNRVLVQVGLLADAGDRWLTYIEKTYPAMMDENWWRSWQQQPARLGVDVSADGERRQLLISRVIPDGPSDGLLYEGDVLLGVRSRRFATTQPIDEMKTFIDKRVHASYLDVLVERNRQTRVVRVPLPYFDPVRSLRRVVAIGRVFDRIAYADAIAADGFGTGRLGLELRAARPPIAVKPPASAPVSQPAAPSGAK